MSEINCTDQEASRMAYRLFKEHRGGQCASKPANQTSLMGSSLKQALFGSPIQYGTLIKRTLKRDPNLENYPNA